MLLLSMRSLLTTLLSATLIVCQVHSYTAVHRRQRSEEKGVTRRGLAPEEQKQRQRELKQLLGGGGGGSGPCGNGWLYTHHHCLLDTGLGAGQEAQVYCSQHDAQEARGICVKKPPVSDPSSMQPSLEGEEDQGTMNPSSSAPQSGHACPLGWTQYQDFCFFKPGTIPKICGLLGANYVFNYCFTRVPHQVPTDFVQALKRLDGSDDYDLHRDTRWCCCRGGGLCK